MATLTCSSGWAGRSPGHKAYDALHRDPGAKGHWLSVRLIGTEPNRSAIGARIHSRITENGPRRSVYRYVSTGSRFGSNPPRQFPGLDGAETIDVLEVYWPRTGRTRTFYNVTASGRS